MRQSIYIRQKCAVMRTNGDILGKEGHHYCLQLEAITGHGKRLKHTNSNTPTQTLHLKHAKSNMPSQDHQANKPRTQTYQLSHY